MRISSCVTDSAATGPALDTDNSLPILWHLFLFLTGVEMQNAIKYPEKESKEESHYLYTLASNALGCFSNCFLLYTSAEWGR